eukprot:GHVU01160466.1.p1 GENE.GHVU01160466.1~~GHVU01160466.1.p1  ORF type:complete len:1262 (-),score=352.75 GHVU01160466.1:349-3780(-)
MEDAPASQLDSLPRLDSFRVPPGSAAASGEGADSTGAPPQEARGGEGVPPSVRGVEREVQLSALKAASSSSSSSGAQKKADDPSDRQDELRQRLARCPAAELSTVFRRVLDGFYSYDDRSKFPSWCYPENIKDKEGRRPFDEGYDYSTLRVCDMSRKDAKEYRDNSRHLTPAMIQYWEIKSDNFDKLVLFKMGRFYEVFYLDALIAQQVCDLRWMGGEERPHVGFPEQSLEHHASKLVAAGFKVCVVEQMETPKELEERNLSSAKGAKDKAVKREVCDVYTGGTLASATMLGGPSSRYLLSVHFDRTRAGVAAAAAAAPSSSSPPPPPGGDCESGTNDSSSSHSFGVAIVDVSTGRAVVGRVADGAHRQALSTLLAQVAPSEIVFCGTNVNTEVLKLFRLLSRPPQLSPTNERCFSHAAVLEHLSEYLCAGHLTEMADDGQAGASTGLDDAEAALKQRLPEAVAAVVLQDAAVAQAMLQLCDYLKTALLDRKLLPFAVFSLYEALTRRRMHLDGAALRNLDVLSSSADAGDDQHSLFGYLNNTSTPFGCRLFRQWLSAPLYHVADIEERLQCVDWFINNPAAAGDLRQRLSKLPDIERLMSRVCGRGVKEARGAVYFSNVQAKHLEEIVVLMNSFAAAKDIVGALASAGSGLPATLARISSCPPEGLFPAQLADAVERVLSKVTKSSNAEAAGWVPAEGADPEFDAVRAARRAAEAEFALELRRVEQRFGARPGQLKYVHSKFRYEVECSDDLKELVKRLRKSEDVDVTSARKGFMRFHTAEIKELVDALEEAEQKEKDATYPFLSRLFRSFYGCFSAFTAAAQLLSELDCLLSLATASHAMRATGPICRPEFLPVEGQCQGGGAGEAKKPFIEMRNARHPVVASVMRDFISNDIVINTGEVDAPCVLVSGPNMGGKSTVLRQAAVIAVIAQLGCYVPAEKCRLSPVDRVFTRIGAFDSLLEGRSTFLVELDEAATALNQATVHSLAVFDELGRGTSTFDGTAVALATAEHLANKIRCRTLFSTHYQYVCEELRGHPRICTFCMQSEVDEGNRSVVYLYKFVPGTTPRSYGLQVASVVGLPEDLLSLAQQMSDEMERATVEVQSRARLRDAARRAVELWRAADSEGLKDVYTASVATTADSAV